MAFYISSNPLSKLENEIVFSVLVFIGADVGEYGSPFR